MMGLGPTELVVILVIVLVIFGPGKLPDLGSSLGKSIREFRKATDEVRSEVTDTVNEVRKPIEDLKRPIDDIRRMPAEVMFGTTSEKIAGKTCPKCSASNPASLSFCGKCGASLV